MEFHVTYLGADDIHACMQIVFDRCFQILRIAQIGGRLSGKFFVFLRDGFRDRVPAFQQRIVRSCLCCCLLCQALAEHTDTRADPYEKQPETMSETFLH